MSLLYGMLGEMLFSAQYSSTQNKEHWKRVKDLVIVVLTSAHRALLCHALFASFEMYHYFNRDAQLMLDRIELQLVCRC